MARRRIGQEKLWGERTARSGGTSLDDVAVLVDCAELDQVLVGVSASSKGEPGWPPLALFRALLLATRHDLSDVKLADALDDRASFRRFCGFSAHEPTPEHTAFVRFQAELVRLGLDRALFEAVTRQLDQRGVVIRTGTLVDATLITSASPKDGEGRWAGHRRRKPMHGYSVLFAPATALVTTLVRSCEREAGAAPDPTGQAQAADHRRVRLPAVRARGRPPAVPARQPLLRAGQHPDHLQPRRGRLGRGAGRPGGRDCHPGSAAAPQPRADYSRR